MRRRLMPIILTPLPDVAVHVVQATTVRLITPYRRRPLQVRPHFLRPIGKAATAVRLNTVEHLPEMEGGRSTGPASVFPLRLRRQGVAPAVSLAQRRAERVAILPRH